MAKPGSRADEGRPAGTSPVEWAVAAFGGAIMAVILGYLVWFGLTQSDGPPHVVVEAGAPRALGDGYLVGFTARNLGTATAAEVLVTGILSDTGAVVEVRQTRLDYVPAMSRREGGLYFRRDPAGLTLDLRAEGYSEP